MEAGSSTLAEAYGEHIRRGQADVTEAAAPAFEAKRQTVGLSAWSIFELLVLMTF